MTEAEAQGFGYQIDHYYPQRTHKHLKNSYKNLMWSCQYCNQRKGGWSPTKEEEDAEETILRPDREDPTDHIRPNGLRVEGKTAKGRVTVERVDLNRYHLRKLRDLRERFWKSSDFIAHGILALLNLSIDGFEPTNRAVFLRIRKRVKERYDYLHETTHDLVRSFARSELLDDPESDRFQTTQEMRNFLRSQNALAPGVYPKQVDSRRKASRLKRPK